MILLLSPMAMFVQMPSLSLLQESGSWVLSNSKDDLSVIHVRSSPVSRITKGGLMPDAMACAPPEVKKVGWSALKECVLVPDTPTSFSRLS
ncbi:hypothetical protein EDB19DRAFT_1724127, partial [Suillus lakei]